jgi:hypothetical protein
MVIGGGEVWSNILEFPAIDSVKISSCRCGEDKAYYFLMRKGKSLKWATMFLEKKRKGENAGAENKAR